MTDDFKEKESDIIFKMMFKVEELYLFLLMEFQSTVDKDMSLRMHEKLWPKNIKWLIENSIPDTYIPDFSYYEISENS